MKESFSKRLTEFTEKCRRAGIRLTHQRLELFREIAGDTGHPSAEDVYRRIRSKLPTISLDTVYRTLSTFEHHGIISKVQVLDERARFDPDPFPHNHLVCVKCKGIADFSWPAFEKIQPPPETGKWGRITDKHAELRGVCKKCLKQSREKKPKTKRSSRRR